MEVISHVRVPVNPDVLMAGKAVGQFAYGIAVVGVEEGEAAACPRGAQDDVQRLLGIKRAALLAPSP